MFIKYQTVRNTVVGATATVCAAFGFVFTRESSQTPTPAPPSHAVAPKSDSTARPSIPIATPSVVSPPQAPIRDGSRQATASVPAEPATVLAEIDASDFPQAKPDAPKSISKPVDPSQVYRLAVQLASQPAARDGKGKDVLGPSSPWKLNLYDDDNDGQWDRGKLDLNRDEIDDENWTFKKGRWEKDGGRTLWNGSDWIAAAAPVKPKSPSRSAAATDPNLARYRLAMKIATQRAARDGKGKDVLGPSSPWKLNLYDDDKDGQWDRGKLDYNRDEVDDEKWNFKDGRWEKDGGKTIWNGSAWIPSGK